MSTTFKSLLKDLNASTVHSGHLPFDMWGCKSSLFTVFSCTGQWQMVPSPVLDWWSEVRAAQRFIFLLFFLNLKEEVL